jgi:hypothetical protein
MKTHHQPNMLLRGVMAPLLLFAAVLFVAAPNALAQEDIPDTATEDPRVNLRAGWMDAEEVASGLELLNNTPRPEGFYNALDLGDMSFANSDMAFTGQYAIVGNYQGFNIYDVSSPASPQLRTSVVCPGGQADVSVYENLVFVSVEEARGRIDCGTQGTSGRVDPERFRGVRVFDISDLDNPTQVAAVQTCRGSHTHTLVTDPNDPDNVYVYVSGASFVRPEAELAGCSEAQPDQNPETALFRIEIIQVPLASPEDARVVSMPRIFADRETGDIAGLWPGGDHGAGTQRTAVTNHCHDITVYPELGLAAGACSGNGILLDISDPVNPVRIEEVSDPNFAYWHSATFNNDGTKVIFTDEWGGGRGAHCKATDPREWGANAIFDILDGRLQFASYYKLPAPQTATENCVAHNGSLVPVPGRDIKVQAWYQGGISVFDFTDSANPVEIAFFDRGPLSDTQLYVAGYWSAYWHNGHIYGSDIARGLDVLRLTPSQHLSQNEIDAALLVRFDEFNPQEQPRIEWPASFVVARAFIDQLERDEVVSSDRIARLRTSLERAEHPAGDVETTAARAELESHATELESKGAAAGAAGRAIDAARLEGLAESLRRLVTAKG